VQGVLLDIGVSSPQIDSAERGFSWRGEGLLDMRMDTTRGETAAQWLARAPIDEITEVIRNYGEERFASSIAKALVARREAGRPPATTGDLAAIVAGAIPRKSRADGAQHPATRTFQAVRIHVNQELEELALALEQSARALRTGGRLVVISFHSLEDRIVKQFIDAHARPGRADGPARALPLRADQLPAPRLTAVARVRADEAEVAANPRARSAVMRVAERTAEPWPETSA
jgi:16S rRNA (cytosine1402-N4)-methyltransferase